MASVSQRFILNTSWTIHSHFCCAGESTDSCSTIKSSIFLSCICNRVVTPYPESFAEAVLQTVKAAIKIRKPCEKFHLHTVVLGKKQWVSCLEKFSADAIGLATHIIAFKQAKLETIFPCDNEGAGVDGFTELFFVSNAFCGLLHL